MMKDFAKQYAEVLAKAERIFNALDSLDVEHKIPNSYVYSNSFDMFEIEGGGYDCATITLKGSWSTPGDWGSNSYDLSLEEFENSEQYIADYEAKLQLRLEEYRRGQQELLEQQKNREYQEYLKLKKKFEDS